MASVTWKGIACIDCACIIANDDDSGIADATAHRARMAAENAVRHGYLVIGDSIDAGEVTCDTCGAELPDAIGVFCGTNAFDVAALGN